MRQLSPAMALLILAACAPVQQPVATALPAPSGDPLADTASLLAAAEEADGAAARAPIVARLDAMNVTLAAEAMDDPLAAWRREYRSAGGAEWRGRTLGPAYRRAVVPAGQSLRIEQIFYAGRHAEIAAEASNGARIALQISTPRAEEVCARRLAPSARCGWLPIFTERFAIELANSGSEAASVYLVFR